MTQNELNYRDLLHREIVLHTVKNGGIIDRDVVLNNSIPVIRDGHGVVYILGINGDDGNMICEDVNKQVRYLRYMDLEVNTLYDLHRAVVLNQDYKLFEIEW
jgi:hypothetical protein